MGPHSARRASPRRPPATPRPGAAGRTDGQRAAAAVARPAATWSNRAMPSADLPPAAAGSRARLAWTLTAGARLRAAYAERVLRGTFLIELPTPVTVRALALAGFDFAVLDLEHSTIGVEGLPGLIAEARAVDLPVLVRVWANEPALVGKVLDAGANGVMVPHVATPEAAARAVRAARWAPRGERGVAPLVSAVAAPDRDARTTPSSSSSSSRGRRPSAAAPDRARAGRGRRVRRAL